METLKSLLQDACVRKAMNSSAMRGTAAFGALLIVLRFYLTRRKSRKISKHITDIFEIARKVKTEEREYDPDEFDVVVIGGGTAGCVIASRLSEDLSIRVLLLEAGESGVNHPFSQIPSAYGNFWLGKHEWGMYTEPQDNASGRKIFWPRAKLLGGCTNMNAMMFHYGAPSDYDEWATLQRGQSGASEWSYEQFHPYFHKFEKYNPSGAFPDVDVTLRGTQGLVNTGYHGHFGTSSAAFIKASSNAGIAHSHDVNTHKGTLGVTKVLTYITPEGRRATAELAYFTPDVLARPNLKIATNARVTRILFDNSNEVPRAVGVEFTDRSGSKYVTKALKEVILAAGAVHTPQILMLSGVGPADHISSFGIPVVRDLPGVGSHLKDHIVVDLAYMDKTGTSLGYLRPKSTWQTVKLLKALMQYNLTGKGPLTTNVGEAAGFVRSSDPILFPANEFKPETAPEDVTSGANAPDLEVYSTPMAYKDHGLSRAPNWGGDAFSLHAVVLRPKSCGVLRLRSNNPADPPIIDPRYLSDEDNNDVKVLVRGIRLLHKISHTEPLASMLDPAGNDRSDMHQRIGEASDAELEQFCRDNVQTLYHPACTARMAPLEDGGVVDPYLRVHGIPNLRVADASVFPSLVAGHTTAPCYAIGEKVADLVKNHIGGRRVGKRT